MRIVPEARLTPCPTGAKGYTTAPERKAHYNRLLAQLADEQASGRGVTDAEKRQFAACFARPQDAKHVRAVLARWGMTKVPRIMERHQGARRALLLLAQMAHQASPAAPPKDAAPTTRDMRALSILGINKFLVRRSFEDWGLGKVFPADPALLWTFPRDQRDVFVALVELASDVNDGRSRRVRRRPSSYVPS